METIYLDSATCLAENACATIGFFDGVHRGHRALLEELKRLAKGHGLLSMVITFAEHPRKVVGTDWQPRLLTTLEEKRRLMDEAGIDRMVVLRFDAAMAGLSAREFMLRVLKGQLGVRMLLTGYDNRFGHDRREGFSDYVAYGREMGIDVRLGQMLSVGEGAVSSSRVRRLLTAGNVGEAAVCLGRRYEMAGCVVHGEQIGRQMGFPTANLEPDDRLKLVPMDGVYAVTAAMEDDGRVLQGLMNIGSRPTFDGHRRTLEVHLLDFGGDIYGRRLRVAFVERLRDELHFDSAESLRLQMEHDKAKARRLFAQLAD